MALTRITKGVIKPNENYDTHDINSTGIITATGANITGNMTVGGVLTYEDVSSIDAVGIITANQGIHVGAGVSAVGVGTFGSLDIGGDIDVDGHTELDNVSVSGILTVTADHPRIRLVDTNANDDFQISNYNGTFFITDQTDNHNRFSINSAGRVDVFGALYGGGRLDIAGNAFIHTNLDVDGHTNLDNVNIAGVTTFAQGISVVGSVSSGSLSINAIAPTIYLNDSDANSDFTIQVNSGLFKIMDSTNSYATRFSINSSGNVSIAKDLDVDGHTELDNLKVNGISTFSGTGGDLIKLASTNAASRTTIKLITNGNDWEMGARGSSADYPNNFYIFDNAASSYRMLINPAGVVSITGDLDVDGHTNLDNVSIAGVTTMSGILNTTENIRIAADNKYLTVGASDDLLLVHDGSHSRIKNTTGTLFLQSDGIKLKNNASTEHYISCVDGGAVELYHNGTKRLETSSVGVSIPQDLDVDGHTNLDNVSIAGVTTFTGRIDASDNIAITSGNRLYFGNSDVAFIKGEHGGSGYLSFGANNEHMRLTRAGNLGIGINSPVAKLHVHNSGTGAGDHAYAYFTTGDTGSDASSGLTIGVNATATAVVNFREAGNLSFGTNSTERLRISPNGDIGINYSGTPNATLDIRTDRDPSNGVMCFLRNNTNDGNGALYGMDINGCGTWSCGMLDNSNNFSIVDGLGNSGTEYFRITSGGQVNIGHSITNSPWGVSGNANTGVRLVNGSTDYAIMANSNSIVAIFNKTNTGGTIVEYKYNANVVGSVITDGTNLELLSGAATKITAGGSERLRITSGGQVNIGGDYSQTSVAAQITGDLLVQKTASAYLNPNIDIYNYVNGGYAGSITFSGKIGGSKYSQARIRAYGGSNTSDGALAIETGNMGEKFRISSDGKVKIGNSGGTPDGKLHIDEIGAGDIVAELTANSPMFTYRNGSGAWFHAGKHPSDDAFVITTGGTTTTSEKFRIAGNGYVTKPKNPAFKSNATGQYGGVGSLTTTVANVGILQAGEQYDHGDNYNTSTYLFTCPVDGVYLVNVTVSVSNVGTNRHIFVIAYTNGGGSAPLQNYFECIDGSTSNYANYSYCEPWYFTSGTTIGVGKNGHSGYNNAYTMQWGVHLLG